MQGWWRSVRRAFGGGCSKPACYPGGKASRRARGPASNNLCNPINIGIFDVSYLNLGGTFYYLCSVLDGYSRSIVHWDLRESMKEADVEPILERAKEKYPEAKPRMISERAAVHRARLQGVHSYLRHDARAHLAVLSAVEWQDRTLAQVAQAGMYPAAHAADSGRCAALDSSLCGSLQHGASAQRNRVCDPAGHAAGAPGRDPCRTRWQTGAGSPPAATPPAAGPEVSRFTDCDYNDFARGNRGGLCREATM